MYSVQQSWNYLPRSPAKLNLHVKLSQTCVLAGVLVSCSQLQVAGGFSSLLAAKPNLAC